MLPKTHSSLLFSFLFLSLGGFAVAQRMPPSAMFGTGTHLCTYQYAIPTGQDCATYAPALENRFKSTRQELDSIRQQFVNQNAQLLENIRQLKQQAAAKDAEVADISKDFQKLRAIVDTLKVQINTPNSGQGNNVGGNGGSGGGAGVTDVMLTQLVSSTRQQLTQDMAKLRNDLNSAVATLSKERQTGAVQQSAVDSAFQDQLRQQQQGLALVVQRLQQLQQRVNSLRALPNPPSFPFYPAPRAVGSGAQLGSVGRRSGGGVEVGVEELVREVRTELQTVEGRVSALEDVFNGGLPDLRHNLTTVRELVEKQTLELSKARTEVDQVQTTEVPELQHRLQVNRGALRQLSDTVRQELDPLRQKVQDVARNVTSLVRQINRLGTDTFTQLTQVRGNDVQISDLSMQLHLLASRLTSLIRDQGFTTPPPSSTYTPPTTSKPSFAVPTPRSHS